jgi:hypothetical protein
MSSLTGKVLIKCKGPDYGIVMDSYHAEAYGLLSITTLVTLFMQYTTNTFASIELLCDWGPGASVQVVSALDNESMG